jgi:hypothetical protein
MGIDFQHLTAEKYAETEAEIRRRAGRCGVRPCEYQAALWQVARMADGRKTTSFLAAADDERQLTLWEN